MGGPELEAIPNLTVYGPLGPVESAGEVNWLLGDADGTKPAIAQELRIRDVRFTAGPDQRPRRSPPPRGQGSTRGWPASPVTGWDRGTFTSKCRPLIGRRQGYHRWTRKFKGGHLPWVTPDGVSDRSGLWALFRQGVARLSKFPSGLGPAGANPGSSRPSHPRQSQNGEGPWPAR
jgi:hypothetical protein